MRDYCASLIALENGTTIVHRADSGCSLIPPEKECLRLGQLSDDNEAVTIAGSKFSKVDGCPQCMPDANHSADEVAIDAAIAAVITVSNM